MHHFSMELLSTSDFPIHPWISIFHPMIIIEQAFITLPLINMSNPDDLKSIFEDPSDIEMEDLSKPNHTLQLKQSSSQFYQPFDVSSAQSWHSPLFLSLP